MKLYSKTFVLKLITSLAEYKDKESALEFLKEFEQDYYRTFPDDFNLSGLISQVCELVDITESEFHSNYKYGNLPLARQLVCYTLTLFGAKTVQISRLIHYYPSRVNDAIKSAQKFLDENPSYHDHIDKITEKL